METDTEENKRKRIVSIYTLGCKVNQYESNGMMQKFIDAGYGIKEFEEYADIYIINTCTVTNMSDRKSRQMIRKVKNINPKAILAVVGCYAQVAREELGKIKEIDIILGTDEKKDIVAHIENYMLGSKHHEISDVLHRTKYSDFGAIKFAEKTRAMIKIQDGCDRFCSYCIIPYARGKVASRPIDDIIEEIILISQNGIKEVVLTGIHIASYGKDLKDTTLMELLVRINNIENIQRIRLRLIRTNANNGRVYYKPKETK